MRWVGVTSAYRLAVAEPEGNILLVIYWPSTHILIFKFFLFLAMATCFGISIPSSGQFFPNVCQQLENKIIKIN
jgi:hypothetical protein